MRKLTDEEVSRVLSAAEIGALDYNSPCQCHAVFALNIEAYDHSGVGRQISRRVGRTYHSPSEWNVTPTDAEGALDQLRRAGLVRPA